MKRYLRIYNAIIKINLSLILTYRANFFNNMFSSFAWGVFNFVWIALLTNKAKMIFGWKSEELVIITICYVTLTGLYYTLFSHNFGNFSRIVDRGELDGILLKPIDSQFQISMIRISFPSFIRTIMGVLALIWWVNVHAISIGIAQAFAFVILFGVGVLLMYSVWFLFITILIWYPNLGNLVELLYTLNSFARYPTEVIKSEGVTALLIFIPISLIVSTPVKALLQKNAGWDVMLLVVISACLFYISRLWWKYALKHYTSAS